MRPLPLLLEFAPVNDRNRIGRPDFPRRLIGAPVETRFQQQSPPVSILGQPRGNGGAGRAAAHDDHIIHGIRSRYVEKPGRTTSGWVHSDLSMFQNTGVAGPSSTPVSSLCHTLGAKYCPSGI